MRPPVVVVLLCLSSRTLVAGHSLELQLYPARCDAPCTVRLTIRTERHPDNRAIVIETDSPTFFRSSLIPLDGRDAPLVHYYELEAIPAGDYQVRARLIRAGDDIARDVKHLHVLWSLREER